jgi:GT2 family glycosyltransferase
METRQNTAPNAAAIASNRISHQEPVYLVIPVYNRKSTTLACLKNLAQIGVLKNYHVVIVDDGSTDGTAEAIKAQYREVEIVTGDGDLWWTGAMAKGMQYAYERGAEYFIWLNDDCLPDSNAIADLVAFLKAHPNTLAAPSCYAEQENALLKQHNGARGKTGCMANTGEILEVDSMSGWCVGIPATVFEKIGAPDAQKFPHYSGDDMYVRRATRAGFKAYLLGDLQVILAGGVHENLDLAKYFQAGLDPIATLRAVFWNKKSPYRLPTRFYGLTERYGILLGTLFFLTKLTLWSVRGLLLYLNWQFKKAIVTKLT